MKLNWKCGRQLFWSHRTSLAKTRPITAQNSKPKCLLPLKSWDATWASKMHYHFPIWIGFLRIWDQWAMNTASDCIKTFSRWRPSIRDNNGVMMTDYCRTWRIFAAHSEQPKKWKFQSEWSMIAKYLVFMHLPLSEYCLQNNFDQCSALIRTYSNSYQCNER